MLTNKKSLLALSVVSALALTACGSDNDDNVVVTPPVVNPPVIVSPEDPTPLSFVVTANVTDVDTTDVVANASLKFFETVDGENVPSTNVLDVNGNAVSTIDLTNGSFVFTLKEGSTVNSLIVIASATGYASKSFTLDLTDKSADLASLLELKSTNVEGVKETVVEQAVSGGSSAETITAQAASGGADSTVAVEAGTVMRDASGNAITGSKVSLALTTASKESGSAAQITPQGLSGVESNGVAITAGVANIEMKDDTGVKIKQFSSPIAVSVNVPATTKIASLGRTIQTGDQLDLSSYNEDTAKWSRETNKATVGEMVGTSSYKVNFTTNHLTFFAVSDAAPSCQSDMGVTISGDAVPAGGLYVNVSSVDAGVGGYLKPGATSATFIAASVAQYYGISAGATAKVTIRDTSGNVWYTSGTEVAVCGFLPVTLTNPVQTVSETFNLSTVCSNDATVTKPLSGATVTYSLPNKAASVASGSGGAYTLANLVQGSTYNVSINPRLAGVAPTSATITADGTAESATVSVACATSTGGTN
ncbi:hypothetical protein ACFFK7_11075 [Pseudoalteromonas xiamenensis]|uniref:hypothetical protein n=1 Tax=Pseudoalteromonas xiamenensis TaxID=882626 RepID=UPI0035E5DB47